MMDEEDLKKTDPKRVGLEKDRILLEYVKNAFKAKLDLYPTRLEEDITKMNNQTDPAKSNIIAYLIEQKKYLMKLIDQYEFEINKLAKEDSL